MRFRPSASLAALFASLALPSAVLAQGRDVYKLPVPVMGAEMGRAQPGVATSSPIGFGPSAGDIFAGFGFQAATASGNENDGSLSVGGGFLDPNKTVGIEAVLTSFSTVRSGFGSRTGLSAKVHKVINGWGVGVGAEGIMLNGNDFDTDPSFYVAATRALTIREAETFSSATVNFGLGNGRFQSFEDYIADESGIGVFLSSSIRVNEFSSAIIDYSGSALSLGLSFTPLKNLPLVVSPSLVDVTGENGQRARLALGAGMSWKY